MNEYRRCGIEHSYRLTSSYITTIHIILLLKLPTPAPIYTLSLHDALPILLRLRLFILRASRIDTKTPCGRDAESLCQSDRKSTRLNSSHSQISYAVFCLKKKNTGTGLRRSALLSKPAGTPRSASVSPRSVV